MKKTCELTLQHRNLFQQGYQSYTPQQLRQIQWGLRFTPAACSLITLFALITQNWMLLFGVAVLGMWAFFFPAGHPMDLIYNRGISRVLRTEPLPPNPFQRRLACFAAGIMNTMAGAFFLLGFPTAAIIVGGMLLVLQAIVIFTHFCTLSWMYEGLMRALGRWSLPLDVKKAAEMLTNGAVLVDVRGPDEFAGGHLPGAMNLPLDEIDRRALSLKTGNEVLVYCASGTRSQIAKQKLVALGLNDVYDIGSMSKARAATDSA